MKDYITKGGNTLHYTEVSEGGSIPLVLIHGQGSCRRDYEDIYPWIAKTYHIYSIDCYGHGESTHDASLYSCKKIGEDVTEFIREVIGENCLIAGHSTGGMIAAYVAGIETKLVKGLLLEDPPFFTILPDEMKDTIACKDGYQVTHNYLRQSKKDGYIVYYLKHSYLFKLFGEKKTALIAKEAQKQLKENPDEMPALRRVPKSALRGFAFWKQYDLQYSEAIYSGSWLDGLDQEQLLRNVSCPVVYLKAKTMYDRDKVLWSATSNEAADRICQCLKDCEKLTVRTSQNIHYEKPRSYVKALKRLTKKKGI